MSVNHHEGAVVLGTSHLVATWARPVVPRLNTPHIVVINAECGSLTSIKVVDVEALKNLRKAINEALGEEA